jgi:hypothetical protein
MYITGYVCRKYNITNLADIMDPKDREEADKLLRVIGYSR